MVDSIFIAAAPTTTWPLDMASLGAQLRNRWPEIRLMNRHVPATNDDCLAFELDIDGERRHGAYFDRNYLLLEDGTPKFWAETIVWFLSLLPVDAHVVGMTEAAPEPIPLPRHADAHEVTAVLESLGS